MSRDITLRATLNDIVGDETFELWLKHETDAWALNQTGDVDPDEDSHQDFVILTLVEDDDYVAQIRLKRDGRYRAGYLTSNPDTWPDGSRCEFTPGALVGAGAPLINSAVWTRTSAVATRITVSINADDLATDLRVFRNGVSIGVIAAPHVNPVIFIDNDPPIAVEHEYTAAHTAGFLDGPLSAPVTVFAGPAMPTAFVRTSADDHFAEYVTTWDSDGLPTRFQDDFLCTGIFVTQTLTSSENYTRNIEDHVIPIGATQHATFHARIRAEVESFSVVDVSDWVTLLVECDIEATNPDYNSCP